MSRGKNGFGGVVCADGESALLRKNGVTWQARGDQMNRDLNPGETTGLAGSENLDFLKRFNE